MTTTDDTPTPEQQPDPAQGQQPDDLDEGQQPDDTGDPDDGQEQQGDRGAQREQRLRARAREAETERDALRTRLERYQRAEVDTVAGEVLAHGGDLLAVRPTLADFLGEDGQVDPAKVREIAKAVAAERPHWSLEEVGRRQPRGRAMPLGNPRESGGSWSDVMSPSGNAGMQ